MQMDMYDEGLLTDENLEKDPVSGNEIPPGGTAEGVRDDIPANLSEGEYVVPANVVKYYGVQFFENLLDNATTKLSDMEEEGRVGKRGEENNLARGGLMGDVFVLEDEPLNMNAGGLVSPDYPNLQGPNPVEEQLSAEQLSTPTVSPQSFEPYDLGFSIFDNGISNKPQVDVASIEYRTYVNQNGEIRIIPFQNGEPMQAIPEGFNPQTDVLEAPTVEDYLDQEVFDTDAMNEMGRDPADRTKTPYAEMTGEQLINGANFGLKAGNFLEGEGLGMGVGLVGTAIGVPLSGLVGKALGKSDLGEGLNIGVASALANARIARARGDTVTENAIYDSIIENSQYSSKDEIIEAAAPGTKLGKRVDNIYNKRSGGSEPEVKSKESPEPTTRRKSERGSTANRGDGAGEERRDNTKSMREERSSQQEKAKSEARDRADSYKDSGNIAEAGRQADRDRGRDYGVSKDGTRDSTAGGQRKDEKDPRSFNKGGLVKKTRRTKSPKSGLGTRKAPQ